MNIDQILKQNHLSLTRQRKEILSILTNSLEALSEQQIKDKLDKNCDRVTIFRNLKTMHEKGLIHKIISDNSARYVFIRESTEKSTDHIHFQCMNCMRVTCLTQLPIADLTLPAGYSISEFNFLVRGICKECNQ